MGKTPITVRIAPEALAALEERLALEGRTRSARLAEAVEDLHEFSATAARLVAGAFRDLTRALADLLPEIAPPLERIRPPAIFLTTRYSIPLPEPVELDWLVQAGVEAVLARAGVRRPAEWPMGGGILAQWGCAVGRALGFETLLAVALGEFCRAWTYGVSARFGNIDEIVGELESAFSGSLTGRVGDIFLFVPAERRLFPAGDADRPLYRAAWRAVLRVLEGIRDGRFAPDGDGRFRDEEGRLAAAVAAEEAAGEEEGA